MYVSKRAYWRAVRGCVRISTCKHVGRPDEYRAMRTFEMYKHEWQATVDYISRRTAVRIVRFNYILIWGSFVTFARLTIWVLRNARVAYCSMG
jgi:hypothetical protein